MNLKKAHIQTLRIFCCHIHIYEHITPPKEMRTTAAPAIEQHPKQRTNNTGTNDYSSVPVKIGQKPIALFFAYPDIDRDAIDYLNGVFVGGLNLRHNLKSATKYFATNILHVLTYGIGPLSIDEVDANTVGNLKPFFTNILNF
mgnify:CR=1 FL=1